jgi:hypothetical protein
MANLRKIGNGLGRRGLFAGGAALLAATVGRTAQPAHAGVDGDVVKGSGNNISATATVVRGAILSSPTFQGANSNFLALVNAADGLQGVTDSNVFPAAGTRGRCTTATLGIGVLAEVLSSDGVGLYATTAGGPSATTPTGAGVFSIGSAVGVHGVSSTGAGVRGVSTSEAGVQGTSVSAYGVQGLSQNAYGVTGNSTTQAGVWGSSNNNVGVLGSSLSGVGVNGVSVSSNGVNGVSNTGIGVYGQSQSGPAGRFDGNVVIQGNLTVSGTFPQSSAVQSSDGTLRRLYSPGSTEAYYEDFGQGSITNGAGSITLDPEFAGLIMTDSYHVFLTPRGDARPLYIASQSASGFEVRESQGGASSIGFSYRVVGRPRSNPAPRLERVTIPSAPAQPKVDRIEPLDVPATIRDIQNNQPGNSHGSGQHVRD